MTQFLVRKSLAALQAEAEEPEVQSLTTHGGVPLKRTLSAANLVALGIGAIMLEKGELEKAETIFRAVVDSGQERINARPRVVRPTTQDPADR